MFAKHKHPNCTRSTECFSVNKETKCECVCNALQMLNQTTNGIVTIVYHQRTHQKETQTHLESGPWEGCASA